MEGQSYNSELNDIRTSSANVGGKVDAVLLSDKDPSTTLNFYDRWAATYEEDLERVDGGYHNPAAIAQVVAKFIKDKNARILDVACGTGLVALELRRRGYSTMDGVDGSQKMLDLARRREAYDHYFLEMISTERMENVPDASYDCVVTTGSFLPGHMGPGSLHTLGRAVRSGGFVFICLREAILTHPELSDVEPRMHELEASGFWRLKERATFENYYNNLPGVTYALEKL